MQERFKRGMQDDEGERERAMNRVLRREEAREIIKDLARCNRQNH